MVSSPSSHTPPSNENDESSRNRSAESSNPISREGSRPPKKRHNVRFTPGGESLDSANKRSAFDLRDDSDAPPKPKATTRPRAGTGPSKGNNGTGIPRRSAEASEDITEETVRAPIRKSRPVTMRLPSSDSDDEEEAGTMVGGKHTKGKEKAVADEEEDDDAPAKAYSQQSAQERAERLSRMVGSHSAPGSRFASPTRPKHTIAHSPTPPDSPHPDVSGEMPLNLDDIPLEKLKTKRTKYGIEDDSDDDDLYDDTECDIEGQISRKRKRRKRFYSSAAHSIKQYMSKAKPKISGNRSDSPQPPSGVQTPVYERDPDNYVPRPTEYRDGFLSSMLKLYDQQGLGSAIAHIPAGAEDAVRAVSRSFSSQQLLNLNGHDGAADTPGQTPVTTPGGSPTSSGTATPNQKRQKWYYKNPASQSSGALSDLVSSSTMMAQPGGAKQSSVVRPKPKHRPLSQQAMDTIRGKRDRSRDEAKYRIEKHIADVVERQAFLLKICRALMTYGAPTHRLEEYMRMCARVLEIDGQFLYIPGCMIISFDDSRTHTTEVKIVRTAHGVDLGKLQDTHEIYKEVIHDVIGPQEAIQRLDTITHRRSRYPTWIRVLMYGFASVCVGPFAFGARPIDLPIIFFLGCILGTLQLVVSPKSDLYSNLFEIFAAILTSFLARAFGSIRHGEMFCFSALAQSAIAMILPGFTVLCGSLELQSRNIVAGSIRIVYAVIFSLFLGYGITIGTSFYGWFDKNATSDTTCRTKMPYWFEWIFVPPFTFCLVIINGAKWKQMPMMIVIAFAGYIVNYWSAKRFVTNAQIANTLGAFTIGIAGNLYSRVWHGLAVAAMIPAIYVQVPSGLAASGSLVSGVTSADQITRQSVNGTYGNGTTTVNSATDGTNSSVNSMVFNVGYSMIQIAIGITVGLFMSALAVYPFGKRRSGLFSF